MHDTTRRDAILTAAIAAGKFSEQRRPVWASNYDRDPAGTEATIALLAVPPHMAQPYPPQLFPELARQTRLARPTGLEERLVAASADISAALSPELVAGWSAQLFPRPGADTAADGHVIWAND
jgi:hypothetical protein